MRGVSVGKRANQISQSVFGTPVGQIAPKDGPITLTPKKEKALDRGHLMHFWYPQRDGVEYPPKEFQDRLHGVKADLEVVRPPVAAPVPHCWYLWQRRPEVTHALSPGWFLLLPWILNGRPLELDEKFFAALWHFDPRNCGGAAKYFDRVIAERDRSKKAAEKKYHDDRRAQQREFFQSTRISSAGHGSKFALHHDGTVIPSPGEVAWSIESRKRLLPSEILKQEREARERQQD